jgi:predicted nucleic acid-binding protein
MTLVVDASITIKLLLSREADALLRQRLSSPRTLHAPHVIDAEVTSGIRGLLLGGKLDNARAQAMVTDYSALRITRHRMAPYQRRVIELRHNLTAYDAFYVALAEVLQAPLFTLDAKFTGATGHNASIHVYPRGETDN